MANPPNSEYMKISEAASFLGVAERWVYRRVATGELPASKVGGLYFINRKDLQDLLDSSRVTPKTSEEFESDSPLPRLKCGFCYRIIKSDDEIGGVCEREGCLELICNKCWKLNIHTCVQHSPNREQRLLKAQQQKEAGEIPILVKSGEARLAETTFLNRIHAHLSSFTTLIHPSSGEVINIPSWDQILETGDQRAELMHLLGKVVLDSTTTAQQPLNAWHHYLTKAKNKKTNPLEVHIQVLSHMETMVRDGFDIQPLLASELAEWIEKVIEQPSKSGNFRLVLLASATGWDASARQVITGSGGYAYSHRLALVYLFDMDKRELIFNTSDDRARRYSELFKPVLSSEELGNVIQAIKEIMNTRDSLTLVDAVNKLAYAPEQIKSAFDALAQSESYVILDIEDFGKTLVNKQVI